MKFILDRVPQYPGRVQLVPVNGVANTYTLTRADDPTEVGTPVNQSLLNEIYGLADVTTVFNQDGSITETDPNSGVTMTTVFNQDGSITETMSNGVQTRSKTTVFNQDGSITETMS